VSFFIILSNSTIPVACGAIGPLYVTGGLLGLSFG